jgi:hypothetical protein
MHLVVSLAEICKFNKMKNLGATDVSTVAALLENSSVIELSEDKTQVKRKEALPAEDDSDDRTIYFVRNFKN